MKNIFSVLFILLLFSSCDDFFDIVIEIDLPEHEPLLVVNSSNTVGQKWTAFVNYSKGALENTESENVSDAQVKIYEGQTFVSELIYSELCNCYVSNEYPERDKTYRIEASHPSYPTAKAEVSVPVSVPLVSVTNRGVIVIDNKEFVAFDLEFEDPSAINYYELEVKTHPILMPVSLNSNDPSIENERDFDKVESSLFNDQLFNNTNKVLSISVYLENVSDSIIVVLNSVSEEYYLYETTRRLQNNGDGALFFGAEPVNVFNSFLNDDELSAYGIFSVNVENAEVVSLK